MLIGHSDRWASGGRGLATELGLAHDADSESHSGGLQRSPSTELRENDQAREEAVSSLEAMVDGLEQDCLSIT